MATEQMFYQPLPHMWSQPDTSTPTYITNILTKIGAIEERLARIEELIRQQQG